MYARSTKPIGNTDVILLSRYEETHTRPQKYETLAINMFRSGGCDFKKLLRDNPDLKNEIFSYHYVKNSPTNIRGACTGVEPRPQKNNTEANRGNKSVMWMLSVYTLRYVSMASLL
jgi:hypothetical protein